MPMVAYFVAKDLTACIEAGAVQIHAMNSQRGLDGRREVTLSSAVFAAAYGYASGSQVSLLGPWQTGGENGTPWSPA